MNSVCFRARSSAEIDFEKKMMIQNKYCTVGAYTQILMLYIRLVLRSSCSLATSVARGVHAAAGDLASILRVRLMSESKKRSKGRNLLKMRLRLVSVRNRSLFHKSVKWRLYRRRADRIYCDAAMHRGSRDGCETRRS
jgi:hypothetical protein